jgi:hypothetical protein
MGITCDPRVRLSVINFDKVCLFTVIQQLMTPDNTKWDTQSKSCHGSYHSPFIVDWTVHLAACHMDVNVVGLWNSTEYINTILNRENFECTPCMVETSNLFLTTYFAAWMPPFHPRNSANAGSVSTNCIDVAIEKGGTAHAPLF